MQIVKDALLYGFFAYGLLTVVISFIGWSNKGTGPELPVLLSNFWKWGICFVLVFYLIFTTVALKVATRGVS